LSTTQEISPPRLRNRHAAATYCGLADRYFWNQVRDGRGPTFVKPSARTVLFREADLDQWMASWRIVPPKAKTTN
jgi:predicted DNA-binding transcriptional regulator AlpA